jgi:transcriptional regulator with XRE-family HTH domain
MTSTTTTGRIVDEATARALRMSYQSLVKAGTDSVRAAWRFGQCIDSFSDAYTQRDLADAMGLSVSTLHRYRRFYAAYQRPELALAASEQLETFNIDIIWELQNQLRPVEHGRPMAGRRFRYRCQHCQATDVRREEITDPAELAELAAREAAMVADR